MTNQDPKKLDSNKSWSKIYLIIVGVLVSYILLMFAFSKAF